MSHYFDSKPVSDHREKEIRLRMAGRDFTLITDQSVFSKQKLDYGSGRLIEAVLQDFPHKTGRLLDLGCGYGAVGIILKRTWPAFQVVMCDINERAVELARRNAAFNQAQAVDIVQSDGLESVAGNFDLILTNPPIRAGKQTVYRLFSEAAARLNPGGRLYVVIRKQQGAPSALKKLEALFGDVTVIDRSAGYWVIRASGTDGETERGEPDVIREKPREQHQDQTSQPGRILPMLALSLLLMLLPVTGCREQPVIGAIDDRATIALIRFEALEAGLNGVVYRQINRFDAFLGASQVPVVVVFYDQDDPVNTLIIPRLEQMADDYRDRLQIVWINAEEQKQVAASFSVGQLPQFTVVVGAVLKRSLIGFDDQGSIHLQELLEPYLN